MKAKVVLPDEASTLHLYDVAFRWGIGADQTDGALSMLEVTIPPRTLIKPHLHTREDEFSLVLAVRSASGPPTTSSTRSRRGAADQPRSVPHAMWNVGDAPARVLEVVTPGGLENYFAEIAPILKEHGPEWTQRYNAAADAYGLDILNDWSDELQERYGVTL